MIHDLAPALSEAGKIKIGGLGAARKAKSGKEYRVPRKDDHFTVTRTERDAAGDLVVDEELMALLPRDSDGKCREIPIVLHDDDFDAVFPTTYALYSGRKLACIGDGRTATRYEVRDGKRTGAQKTVECPCPMLGAKSGPQCKPHGTLRCSIRVRDRAVAGAVHTWRTTSIISIRRMLGSLQQIRDICGTIVGVPLVLRVQPVQVSPDDVSASTVYCCHIELRAADIAAVQRQAIESAQLRAQVRASVRYQLAALPAPGVDETDDEQDEIAQEFHPDPDDAIEIEQPRRLSDNVPAADTGELAPESRLIDLYGLIDAYDEAHKPGACGQLLSKHFPDLSFDAVTGAQCDAAIEYLQGQLSA